MPSDSLSWLIRSARLYPWKKTYSTTSTGPSLERYQPLSAACRPAVTIPLPPPLENCGGSPASSWRSSAGRLQERQERVARIVNAQWLALSLPQRDQGQQVNGLIERLRMDAGQKTLGE